MPLTTLCVYNTLERYNRFFEVHATFQVSLLRYTTIDIQMFVKKKKQTKHKKTTEHL